MISASEARARRAPYLERLRKLRPFARMMADLFSPRDGLFNLTSPETVVCRCEEVTAAQIHEAIDNGASDLTGREVEDTGGDGYVPGTGVWSVGGDAGGPTDGSLAGGGWRLLW